MSETLAAADAYALADVAGSGLDRLLQAANARRQGRYGAVITYSPKVFLPLTTLCRNACDYCTFRRGSPAAGARTMSPDDVRSVVTRGVTLGCTEALFCLGDTPPGSFPAYHAQLAVWGYTSTVDYLVAAGGMALDLGLLPHTNAGILTRAEMARLRPVNVSLGVMLECTSERLCRAGGPHAGAPDKHPARRIQMIHEAGALRIPFTSGLLVGFGETAVERVDTILALRNLHRAWGHLQEVIVQPFTPHPGTPMADASPPPPEEVARTIALARLILDDEVSVQSPPNLPPLSTLELVAAGVNDLGGISPLTPDYINPSCAWPARDTLAATLATAGYTLQARLPVHPAWVYPEWIDPALYARVFADTQRRSA